MESIEIIIIPSASTALRSTWRDYEWQHHFSISRNDWGRNRGDDEAYWTTTDEYSDELEPSRALPVLVRKSREDGKWNPIDLEKWFFVFFFSHYPLSTLLPLARGTIVFFIRISNRAKLYRCIMEWILQHSVFSLLPVRERPLWPLLWPLPWSRIGLFLSTYFSNVITESLRTSCALCTEWPLPLLRNLI